MSSNYDSYAIYYKNTPSSAYVYYDTSSSSTPVLTSLNPNTNYYIRLIPYSNTSNFYGSPIDVSTTTMAQITSSYLYSVDSWSSLTLKIDGCYNYIDVSYSTDDINYTNYGKFSGNFANITDLIANQRYYFKVTPYNNIGDLSTTVYIKDAGSITMGNIYTLSYSNVDSSSVTLNWSGVYEYLDICYNNNIIYIATKSTTVSNTYTNTISDLSAGTSYTFSFYPYNSYSLNGKTSSLTVSTSDYYFSYNKLIYYTFQDTKRALNTNIQGVSDISNAVNGVSIAGYSINTNLYFSNSYTLPGKSRSIYFNKGLIKTTSTVKTTANVGLTISIWFYATSFSSNPLLFKLIRTTDYEATCAIYLTTTTNSSTTIYSSNTDSIRNIYNQKTNIGTVSKNKWHHLVVEFDTSENSSVSYYLDGVYKANSSPKCIYDEPTHYITIGETDNPSWNNPFVGYISHFAVYNTFLSSSAISTIYNNYL